jgi:hypothetical protein
MATNILASGTIPASSSDQTLADGASHTLIKVGLDSQIDIEAKTVSGYRPFGALTDLEPVLTITGPIIYRVTRGQVSGALAVDRE